MTRITPLRFFWTVMRPLPAVGLAVVGTAGVGLYLSRLGGDALEQALPLALLVAMFTSSSGYKGSACRGHFDPVLAGSGSRARVATAHWLVTGVPAWALWLTLSGVDAVLRPGHVPTALSPPALAAVLYVSAACWAVNVPFGRYMAATVWLLALGTVGATRHVHILRDWYFSGSGPFSVLKAAAAGAACPLLLAGRPDVPSTGAVAVVLCLAAAWWAAGVAIVRLIQPVLEEPS